MCENVKYAQKIGKGNYLRAEINREKKKRMGEKYMYVEKVYLISFP